MSMKREAKRCMDIFKAEYADNMCRVGEVLLSFTSGILTLVTFGTAFWLQAKKKEVDGEDVSAYHFGLWQNCTVSGTSGCHNFSLGGPGYFISARIFMTLALIACVLSWIFSIVGLLQHRYRWLFAATIAYAIQATSSILGLTSFIPSFKQGDTELKLSPGWSYNVGWLSMVMSILCALYFSCVGFYQFRNPTPSRLPVESRSYAPLAQFESTETGSDDDDYDDDL